MLYTLLITGILIIIDFLLLTFMVHFYFFIGIPIFKRSFMINSKRSLEDIGIYVDRHEYLVYKISNKDLIFRSEFTFFNLCLGLRFLSIIKGDIKIVNGRAIVTQRINLTTIYYDCFAIYWLITANMYILGYFFIGLILLFTLLVHRKQNANINEVCNNIIKYMN